MSSASSNTKPAIRSPVMRELEPRQSSKLQDARLVFDLNSCWRFQRLEQSAAVDRNGDGELPSGVQDWELVNLPHSVRLEPINASGGRNFQGVCWYSRQLDLPEQWRDRKIYLHFEGAMQVADVWLNGQKIASHHCGYTPFTIDITPFVDFTSSNILFVRLDNSDNRQVPPGKPQAKLDFTYFGGLYRNVRLIAMDRLHLTDPMLADRVAGGGVFVRYSNVSSESATVSIRSEVQNEHAAAVRCTLRHELVDTGGVTVAAISASESIDAGRTATFEQSVHVVAPQLWHPRHPHLYTLHTNVVDESRGAVVDEQISRIGIRHIRFDKDDGLFINGEKFLSIGANRHQDHPYVGYALPDSAHWRDAEKLRGAGFTSCRCHYPQSPAFMDACDELGILTIVSNPGWQYVGDDIFQQRAIHNARVMVRRDRNRPSVILWEAALNESDNRALGAALQQAVHEEFPGDQCYSAGDHEPNFTWRGAAGWDVEFFRNDGSKPYWIREWGDHVDNWRDQQSPNRIARGWGEGPMLVQAQSHLARMNEIMVAHHGSSSGADARRLCGACLWAGIDHARGYHHQNFHGGVLDLFRLPKFSYYFFQSQRPTDEGPMVFIANFASFLSPPSVMVFSNCEQVRLLRDGKEIGVQACDAGHRIAHPPFTFQTGRLLSERTTLFMNGSGGIEPAPVELKAEGLVGGRVVATHVVHPPGVAKKLLLEADLCDVPLVADRSDWVRVYAKICDARDTICPLADDLITFSARGEGEIIGDGNSHVRANPMRAEAGIATALVRATATAGKIIVNATAFGLADGEIEIVSRAPANVSLLPAEQHVSAPARERSPRLAAHP